MRFLHIIHRYHPFQGGSEKYIQDVSERLVQEGHEVTVLTTDAWDLDYFWTPRARRIEEPAAVHNGVRILRFPVKHLPARRLAYPALGWLRKRLGRLPAAAALNERLVGLSPWVPGLGRHLARTSEKFDLVHTTNIAFDFAVAQGARFAKRRNVPQVCTPFLHLGEPGNSQVVRSYAQPHQIRLLQGADRVLVQTDLEGQFLRSQQVATESLRTIGCWVKPDELRGGDRTRFRSEYGITTPTVVSIGAAAYDKGTIHTVQAMQRLWRSGSEAILVLIAGTILADFEQFLAGLPEEEKQRIRLVRSAPHQVKLDALAAADVFVLPSRTDSFGIVFLEAWMYGLPVIGARAGGIPAVIDHERDGLLVDFADVPQLASALVRLLDSPAQRSALGKRGQEKTYGQFTFDRKYSEIRGVYEEVLGTKL